MQSESGTCGGKLKPKKKKKPRNKKKTKTLDASSIVMNGIVVPKDVLYYMLEIYIDKPTLQYCKSVCKLFFLWTQQILVSHVKPSVIYRLFDWYYSPLGRNNRIVCTSIIPKPNYNSNSLIDSLELPCYYEYIPVDEIRYNLEKNLIQTAFPRIVHWLPEVDDILIGDGMSFIVENGAYDSKKIKLFVFFIADSLNDGILLNNEGMFICICLSSVLAGLTINFAYNGKWNIDEIDLEAKLVANAESLICEYETVYSPREGCEDILSVKEYSFILNGTKFLEPKGCKLATCRSPLREDLICLKCNSPLYSKSNYCELGTKLAKKVKTYCKNCPFSRIDYY